MSLYPFKFTPILKEKIWGGQKLSSFLGKNQGDLNNIGESWELSTVANNVSVVCNGDWSGVPLDNLIKEFKEELVGQKIYNQFGSTFPLLIKFIDASSDLSIQVHPDDDLALRKHNSFGKSEMWYVLDDRDRPSLVNGFNRETSSSEVRTRLLNNSIAELFNIDHVLKDDVVYIPAGRIHAICKGAFVAEIQQSSDVTYRLYDYDRNDTDGNKRDLHIDDALDALSFSSVSNTIIRQEVEKNKAQELLKCPFFTCNTIHLESDLDRDYSELDSYVVLICVEGKLQIIAENLGVEVLEAGEVILIPAKFTMVKLNFQGLSCKLLEVYQ